MADSIEALLRKIVLSYDQEVRDPHSLHFRDAPSATLWLSDVQRKRREIAEWVHQELPVFRRAVEPDTLEATLRDAFKIAGHLMTFNQVIQRAEARIKKMGEADQMAMRRLERDTAAAEKAVGMVPKELLASGG